MNIKNPAGDYVQRDSNVDVIRQVSQARARLEKETAEAEKAAAAAAAAAEGGEVAQQVRLNICVPVSVRHAVTSALTGLYRSIKLLADNKV